MLLGVVEVFKIQLEISRGLKHPTDLEKSLMSLIKSPQGNNGPD